jgi:phosphoribosyl 1,2-cyclic phosphodiesterase
MTELTVIFVSLSCIINSITMYLMARHDKTMQELHRRRMDIIERAMRPPEYRMDPIGTPEEVEAIRNAWLKKYRNVPN